MLDSSAQITETNNPKIIRFRHYSKILDPNNYFHEQLMLFFPWRDEHKDLLNIDHVEKARTHSELISVNSQPYYFDRNVDKNVLNSLLTDLDEDIENCEDETNNFLFESFVHIESYETFEVLENNKKITPIKEVKNSCHQN